MSGAGRTAVDARRAHASRTKRHLTRAADLHADAEHTGAATSAGRGVAEAISVAAIARAPIAGQAIAVGVDTGSQQRPGADLTFVTELTLNEVGAMTVARLRAIATAAIAIIARTAVALAVGASAATSATRVWVNVARATRGAVAAATQVGRDAIRAGAARPGAHAVVVGRFAAAAGKLTNAGWISERQPAAAAAPAFANAARARSVDRAGGARAARPAANAVHRNTIAGAGLHAGATRAAAAIAIEQAIGAAAATATADTLRVELIVARAIVLDANPAARIGAHDRGPGAGVARRTTAAADTGAVGSQVAAAGAGASPAVTHPAVQTTKLRVAGIAAGASHIASLRGAAGTAQHRNADAAVAGEIGRAIRITAASALPGDAMAGAAVDTDIATHAAGLIAGAALAGSPVAAAAAATQPTRAARGTFATAAWASAARRTIASVGAGTSAACIADTRRIARAADVARGGVFASQCRWAQHGLIELAAARATASAARNEQAIGATRGCTTRRSAVVGAAAAVSQTLTVETAAARRGGFAGLRAADAGDAATPARTVSIGAAGELRWAGDWHVEQRDLASGQQRRTTEQNEACFHSYSSQAAKIAPPPPIGPTETLFGACGKRR